MIETITAFISADRLIDEFQGQIKKPDQLFSSNKILNSWKTVFIKFIPIVAAGYTKGINDWFPLFVRKFSFQEWFVVNESIIYRIEKLDNLFWDFEPAIHVFTEQLH